MQFNLIELWPAMGPLAKIVMVILVVMSLVSLVVAVERVLKLTRSARESAAFLVAWRRALGDGGVSTAAARAADYPRSYVAHLVREVTDVIREPADDSRAWLEAYDRTARRVIVAAGIDAKQGLGVLATVGSTAPFVGLFGTVVGIVTAFHCVFRPSRTVVPGRSRTPVPGDVGQSERSDAGLSLTWSAFSRRSSSTGSSGWTHRRA